MSLTNAEFQTILDDPTKRIDRDLAWMPDEDHSAAIEFVAEVRSDPGYPLFVKGRYNPLVPAITLTLILKGVGRIYALDLGKDHINPDRHSVGDVHKHRWSERFRDKEAYVPSDITARATDPVAAWRQFCAEARIRHEGSLPQPPSAPEDSLE